MAAQQLGAGKVFAVDSVPYRRDMASSFGASAVSPEEAAAAVAAATEGCVEGLLLLLQSLCHRAVQHRDASACSLPLHTIIDMLSIMSASSTTATQSELRTIRLLFNIQNLSDQKGCPPAGDLQARCGRGVGGRGPQPRPAVGLSDPQARGDAEFRWGAHRGALSLHARRRVQQKRDLPVRSLPG